MLGEPWRQQAPAVVVVGVVAEVVVVAAAVGAAVAAVPGAVEPLLGLFELVPRHHRHRDSSFAPVPF